MSVPTVPDEETTATSAEDRIELRLARIEDSVQQGNREGRSAGTRFMIFAALALVIALGNLIAVAAKLDGSSSATKATGQKPAAVAPTPAAAPARDVGVTLREYSVAPAPALGRAGKVTFRVRNAGAIPHEFVVLRTAKPAGSLLKGAEADEAGNVGEIGDVQPGRSKTLTLPLKAGHYALICNLPGHYKAGQHADFTVR